MLPFVTKDNASHKASEDHLKPSNEIAPEDEQEIIRTLISDSQNLLDCLNNEIRTHQIPSHPPLVLGAKEISRMEKLRNGVIAPFDAVPPEVLSHIFIYTVDERIPNVRPGRYRCPWNLILVCSRWRAICLAEASLWNTMKLVVSANMTSPAPFVAPRDNPVQHRLVAPFLQCLKVQTGGLPADLDLILAPFSQCKHLRSVEFMGPPYTEFRLVNTNLRVGFPWTQLTELIIPYGGVSPFVFILVLRQSVNLVSVEVALKGSLSEWEDIDSVTMPNLRSLELNSLSSSLLRHFVKFLVLPALETLNLGSTSEAFKPPWSSGTLIRMVSQSHCVLKHFSIQNLEIPGVAILSVLRCVPGLASLLIQDFQPVPESFLESMREENLVPDLEVLSVRVGSFRGCRQLLQARYNGMPSYVNRRMREVRLVASHLYCGNQWDDFAAFISQSQDEGRNIVVWWDDPDTELW